MEREPDGEEPPADERRPPLALRCHGDAACELTRNGEEQEYNARDHQDSRDWSTLQRLKYRVHLRAPPAVHPPCQRQELVRAQDILHQEIYRDYNAEPERLGKVGFVPHLNQST